MIPLLYLMIILDMKNQYIGWTLFVSIVTLVFSGMIEGFTGQPFLGVAGDTTIGMITTVAGIWGSVLLIKK